MVGQGEEEEGHKMWKEGGCLRPHSQIPCTSVLAAPSSVKDAVVVDGTEGAGCTQQNRELKEALL